MVTEQKKIISSRPIGNTVRCFYSTTSISGRARDGADGGGWGGMDCSPLPHSPVIVST